MTPLTRRDVLVHQTAVPWPSQRQVEQDLLLCRDLQQERSTAGRAEFTELLEAHLADRGFCSDMEPLLRTGVGYDPREAGNYVKKRLLSLLPER